MIHEVWSLTFGPANATVMCDFCRISETVYRPPVRCVVAWVRFCKNIRAIALTIHVQATLQFFRGRCLRLQFVDRRFRAGQRRLRLPGVATFDLAVQGLDFALRLAQSVARGRRARRLVQLHLQLVCRRLDGVHSRTIAAGIDHL